MKNLLGVLIAMIMTQSQASMNQNGNEHFGNPTVIVAQQRTVTRNVPAFVKKIVKPRLFVSKPFYRAEDLDDVESEDIITSYRRRDLNKLEHENGISDNVRWKLFLIRQLAMLKYKEKWT